MFVGSELLALGLAVRGHHCMHIRISGAGRLESGEGEGGRREGPEGLKEECARIVSRLEFAE